MKSALRQAPYNLRRGQTVVARVQAYNERGWGDLSQPNSEGANIQTQPIYMHAPIRGINTATNQVQVDWSTIAPPDNGDAEVTSYSLEWDANTNGASWVSLVGYLSNYLGTSYLVTDNVIEGREYQFRLRAKNVWGWGVYSDVTTVKAAREPLKMTNVATSVDAATGDLVISWQEPNIQGDAITEYLVEIANKDQSTWSEYTPTCGGEDPSLL